MRIVRRINSTNLLTPLIITDLSLLPMFHIGSIPWKPSILLIAVMAIVFLRRNRFHAVKLAVPSFILGIALFITTLIGALTYWIVAGVQPGTETLRMLMIFTLIPLSFTVGLWDHRRSHTYIGWILVVIVVLNIVIFVAPEQMKFFANFYGLEKAYELPAYNPATSFARIAGIFQSASISALAITVLMTFIALGYRLGFIRPNPHLLVLFVSTGVFGTFVLVSRTQMVVATLLALFTFFWVPRRLRFQTLGLVLAGGMLTGVVLVASPALVESAVGFDLVERIEYQSSRVIQDTLASFTGDSSGSNSSSAVLRPFLFWDRAFERITDPAWIWIFGTGAEDSIEYGNTHFHNDWISVLTSSGAVGLTAFAVLVAYFGSISLLLALPFILPGMVKAFLFSPQFVVLTSILAGMVARKISEKRNEKEHAIDIAYMAVDPGLSIDNSPVFRSQIIDAAEALSDDGIKTALIATVENHGTAASIINNSRFVETQTILIGRLPLMIAKSAWRLRRMNRRHSIKTVYARGIWGALVCHLAFPLFNGPNLIYDFRGDVVAESRKTGNHGIRLSVLRLLTQLAIRSATKHLSVSESGARKLSDSYGVKNVGVIPSGTNVAKFEAASESRAKVRRELGFDDSDIVLVYSGGLAHYQMIPEMLAIWNKIDRKGLKFLLLISTQPVKGVEHQQLLQMLPSQTTVLTLAPEEVPSHLAAADIGFMLRERLSLNSVASPVKFAEYLASGNAVITSPALDDAAIQVQNHDLGVVISPNSSDDEIASLNKFLDDFPKQKTGISQRALSLAKARHDWSAYPAIWRREILD